jgi:hypothetical protein
MIRCKVKTGKKQVAIQMVNRLLRHKKAKSKFFKIRKNDVIVYYALGAGVIVGLFKVISAKPTYFEDECWEKCSTLKIQPVNENNTKYLDFRKLAKERKFQSLNVAKMLEDKEPWVVLKEEDFNIIEQAFSDESYAIKIKNEPNEFGSTGWIMDPEVIGGVLDYYNSRATSFSSLFVASLFGLVTLAAIIQSIFKDGFKIDTYSSNLLFFCFSFLYVFFYLGWISYVKDIFSLHRCS